MRKNNLALKESPGNYQNKFIDINYIKTCGCKGNNINCMTPKEWMKAQIGVWEFYYEKRDIRDKQIHPATFPISLTKKSGV